MARTKTIPNVGAMDQALLQARVIGQCLSTARQRYEWEDTTIPVVKKHRRGWHIVNVLTNAVGETLAGWDANIRAVVTADAPVAVTAEATPAEAPETAQTDEGFFRQ